MAETDETSAPTAGEPCPPVPFEGGEDEMHYKEPSRKEWRGFWTLVAVQAQNAFNEKAVQFLLIPLGVWLWGASGSTLEYTLGAIFMLPYILFSPLVGWLADCFCKTRIIQVMSLAQIVVMSCMLFCFYQHDMTAAILWFAVFATQATILSPAKKGIVKDLLGSKYIGFGSGIVEMSMVGVLLIAQIGVFFWFSYLLDVYNELPDAVEEAGWSAVKLPTWVFLILAGIVSAASFLVPRYPAKQPRPFSWSLFYEHFVQVKYLWKDRLLRLSELGISYFWCLAGSLFLIIIQIAKQLQEADPECDFSLQCGILMAWLTGGVLTGGAIASQLCKGKNELGLIPFGAIGITVCTFMLVCLDVNTYMSNIFLAFTGAFGAAYLVPLNAFLQDHCDPANRGNIIAAGNLIDNVMGLVAVGLMWMMHEYGASPQNQFFVLFLLSVFIMVTSLRLIPQEFIRMVGIWCMRLVYRPRTLNPEYLPERGGALLVANHVTYADALFITMVCPRPVRFVVAEEFMASRLISWVLEIFNALPISSKNPREAISNAAEGLANGELICVFPEGQLTRSGCLIPIRRGIEQIARRAQVPIIPLYMDGLWGSVFSFSRSRFFAKMPKSVPYSFTVAVGRPISPASFDAEGIVRTFRSLAADCLEVSDGGSREALLLLLERMGNKPLVHCSGGTLSGIQIAAALIARQPSPKSPAEAIPWLKALIAGTENIISLHRSWLNACQIRRTNTLKEGHHMLTTVGHGESHEFVLGVLWPILTQTPVHIITDDSRSIDPCISQMVGGAHMRSLLIKVFPPRQIPFFDFSLGPDLAAPNMRWRPCMATSAGTVLSMSMRSSVFKMSDGTVQLGARPRTRGLLLPCFCVDKSSDGTTVITGQSLAKPYTLPEKYYVDESGFLGEFS